MVKVFFTRASASEHLKIVGTEGIMNIFLKKWVLALASSVTLGCLVAPAADASFSLNFKGETYDITTVTGTYLDLESQLLETPWSENQGAVLDDLRDPVNQVAFALGRPNYFPAFDASDPNGPDGFTGPLFAWRENVCCENVTISYSVPLSFNWPDPNFSNGIVSLNEILTYVVLADDLPEIDFGSNPVNFSFSEAEDEAEIVNQPSLDPRVNGFSISGLSYELSAQSSNPVIFSWDATRDFNLSDNADIFASIMGNTNLSGDTPASLEFFVEGYIDDSLTPFARFQTDVSQLLGETPLPLSWDITEVVPDLLAGEHTLGIVSGVQWTPSAVGDTLLISSQYGGDVTPVPTPALLPGLVAMGITAIRKRTNTSSS